jgi:hypothetical protein
LAERWLGFDDQAPAGGVIKVAEQHRCSVAEDLYELRVELGAAPFPRDGDRCVDSAGPAKDLDAISEIDEPRSNDDFGAFEGVGNKTCAPTTSLSPLENRELGGACR